MSMSDQDDWKFAGPDDAKAEIRAAVGYLLRGATGGARGDTSAPSAERESRKDRLLKGPSVFWDVRKDSAK
jgi:hypothetical protein